MNRPSFSGAARINYLSTLRFGQDLLDRVASAAEGVEVLQIPADEAEQIDPDVWAQVDVLHTSTAICDPSAAPRLRWVQLDTSGVDHLRDHPIWPSEVMVTTIGGVSPVPLAEYVVWAVLGIAHRLPELLRTRDTRVWPSPTERWRRMLPAPLRGATIGIVGYGRIGREIGRLAAALGMTVLGLSRTAGERDADSDAYFHFGAPASASPVERFGPDGLHEVMRRSDYLVVVVPLTDSTAGMVDAEALGQLKEGAAVVNVARGGIVDESALREGLRSGRIRAAVLDVFDEEPLGRDDPWWTEENAFVTPHVSGFAPEYPAQVTTIVQENMRRFGRGLPLMNLVDRTHGY